MSSKKESDIAKVDFFREKIDNTPFHIIKNTNGWFIVWGMYMLTEVCGEKEEALDKLCNTYAMVERMLCAIEDAKNKNK